MGRPDVEATVLRERAEAREREDTHPPDIQKIEKHLLPAADLSRKVAQRLGLGSNGAFNVFTELLRHPWLFGSH